MNTSELYSRVASVTTRFDFSVPVEAADLEFFRSSLAQAIGPGFQSGVALLSNGRVLVEVWSGSRRVYARELIVE